jgi:fibronectin type 3 domain-containing protein
VREFYITVHAFRRSLVAGQHLSRRGYNVCRRTTDGGPYQRINSTLITSLSYTDSSVGSSTTYYYVSTAVDFPGVESEYSNQATAVIP